jgi:hypothetical protein
VISSPRRRSGSTTIAPRRRDQDPIAQVEAVRERVDLDVMGAAALGTDPEGAEQPLPRLEGLDCGGLLDCSPAPLFDLLGIGGAPALRTGRLRRDLARPDPSLPIHLRHRSSPEVDPS